VFTSNDVENRVIDKHAMTLRLPRRVRERLERQARAEGATNSAVIRRAIERELAGVADASIETR